MRSDNLIIPRFGYDHNVKVEPFKDAHSNSKIQLLEEQTLLSMGIIRIITDQTYLEMKLIAVGCKLSNWIAAIAFAQFEIDEKTLDRMK